MRTFAIQLLFLLRTQAFSAAPLNLWPAVETLEDGLRSDPWPQSGEYEASSLMQRWNGVTLAARSSRGPLFRGAFEVQDAVTGVMGAVSAGRSADRHGAEAARELQAGQKFSLHTNDRQYKLHEASRQAGTACLIASEIGVSTHYFEAFRPILLLSHCVLPGLSRWKDQQTMPARERMRNFTAYTIQAMQSIFSGVPDQVMDELQMALWDGGDDLTTAIDQFTAAASSRLGDIEPEHDPDSPRFSLFLTKRAVLLAIDAMLDGERADAWRRSAAERTDPAERPQFELVADAFLSAAHAKGVAVCNDAKAAGVRALQLALMRSCLPVSGS